MKTEAKKGPKRLLKLKAFFISTESIDIKARYYHPVTICRHTAPMIIDLILDPLFIIQDGNCSLKISMPMFWNLKKM